MRRRLLIMRHGKSLHGAEYPVDFDRPLAPRGVRAAKLMGQFIKDSNTFPDLIITSPATRALSTAKLISEEVGGVQIVEQQDIYDGDTADLLELIKSLPDDQRTIMLIGHNPDFEDIVDVLTDSYDTVLKTCSMAIVDSVAETWGEIADLACKLTAVYHPRELPAINIDKQ